MWSFLRVLAISYALLALGDAFCVGDIVTPLGDAATLPIAIDARCRDRFLDEAVPAWKQLRERLRGFELELAYLDHRPEEKEPDAAPLTSTYCVLSDGVSRQLHRDDKLDVTNSQYSFKVSRSGDAYHLSGCELWQKSRPQPLVGWLDVAEMKLAVGSSIWWLPFETLMADKHFVMTGADYGVSHAGEELVRVAYRYVNKVSNDYLLQPDGIYWAEMLPERFWVVVQSGVISSPTEHYDTDTPFRTRLTTRYQTWDGVPFPEDVRYEVVDMKRNVVVRVQENRFGTPRACTRTIDEFYLPHYGLSESSILQIDKGRTNRQLVSIATGIAVLFFAWLLYKRSRVRSAE